MNFWYSTCTIPSLQLHVYIKINLKKYTFKGWWKFISKFRIGRNKDFTLFCHFPGHSSKYPPFSDCVRYTTLQSTEMGFRFSTSQQLTPPPPIFFTTRSKGHYPEISLASNFRSSFLNKYSVPLKEVIPLCY